MRINVAQLIFVALLSVTFAFLYHYRAASSWLRYTRVAEGNISSAVSSIWSQGVNSYKALVRGDAAEWGRIRPLHNIYHMAPFLMSMLRAGDLTVHDDVPWYKRINGDLQTHTIYQLIVASLTIAILSFIIIRTTGQIWPGAVFLAIAPATVSLSQNVLVNYADSGEIGQLFLIAIYLLMISPVLCGQRIGLAREISGLVFMILAYMMKETTVVLTPVITVVLGLSLLSGKKSDTAHSRFAVRQVAYHIACASILLFFVLKYRAGAYVGEHYATSPDHLALLHKSWELMRQPLGVIAVIAVSAIFSAGLCHLLTRGGRNTYSHASGSWLLLLTFLGLAMAFWVINIPWSVPLVKYYLPATWFLMASALAAAAIVYGYLKGAGCKPAAVIWIIGIAFFFIYPLPAKREGLRADYKNQYGYRSVVPEVVRDIADHLSAGIGNGRVLIIGPPLYQEGALVFQRMLNRKHQMNITQAGQAVASVRGPERNYFRRYHDRNGAEISFNTKMPNAVDVDIVYILNNVEEGVRNMLSGLGYHHKRTWQARYGYEITIFVREAPL
jgi:cbb3-type cytochrome oxidase subunit 3